MKRLLLSALLITPGTLLAADAQELPLLSGGDAPTIKNSNLDLFGVSRDFGDIIFIDDDRTVNDSAPKRTRVFTGYEYEISSSPITRRNCIAHWYSLTVRPRLPTVLAWVMCYVRPRFTTAHVIMHLPAPINRAVTLLWKFSCCRNISTGLTRI